MLQRHALREIRKREVMLEVETAEEYPSDVSPGKLIRRVGTSSEAKSLWPTWATRPNKGALQERLGVPEPAEFGFGFPDLNRAGLTRVEPERTWIGRATAFSSCAFMVSALRARAR